MDELTKKKLVDSIKWHREFSKAQTELVNEIAKATEFSVLKDKIIEVSNRIISSNYNDEKDITEFESYAGFLLNLKPSKYVTNAEINALQFYVAVVYRCIDDRNDMVGRLLYHWFTRPKGEE